MSDLPPRESWESLTGKNTPPTAAVPAGDTDEEMIMRAVIAGDGKRLLDWLRANYVEKRNRPGATEAELRESEAQRALVHRLETMRDKGIETAARRRKAK